MARLLAAINGTEYFIASWPAVFLVERVGRRKLMLFGAAGQSISMAVLAGANSAQDNKSAQACAVAFLFVFNTFFAVGWLGMSMCIQLAHYPLIIIHPILLKSSS